MNFLKRIIKDFIGSFGFKLINIKNSEVFEQNGSILTKKENILLSDEGFSLHSPFDELPFAGEAMFSFIQNYKFDTVLDIGSGEGKHSDVLQQKGKTVTSIDFGRSIYFEKRKDNYTCINADYYSYIFEEKFDAIWVSHVLEHQPNPNLFLKKIHNDLEEGGVLAITVPPLKHEIVGGHVTLWNAGLLLYQLILAGFDCSNVSIKSYGYNISVILKKKSILAYPDLSYDSGDINKLKEFFPIGFEEPFNGDIKEFNWK